MEEFKYLGTIIINQSLIMKKIKSRLQSGNACYHSVQNHMYSSLLSKNIKIEIYRTTVWCFLCGCETWAFTLREEHRLQVFKHRVLRKIFWASDGQVSREEEKTT